MIDGDLEELEIENLDDTSDLVDDPVIIEGLIEDEQAINQPVEQVETGELLEEDQEIENYDTQNNPDLEEVIEDLEEISNNSIGVDQVGDSSDQTQDETPSTYDLEDIYQQNEEIIATLDVINRNVKTTGDNISLIGSVISMVLCLFLGGFIIYCFLFRVR